MFLKIPEDIFTLINDYDTDAIPLYLIFKKTKLDNYVKLHERVENLYLSKYHTYMPMTKMWVMRKNTCKELSKRIEKKIEKSCTHKRYWEYKDYVYDECTQSLYVCELCKKDCDRK